MIKWLSVPEYAEVASCSQAMVKNMITKGELVTCTTDGGGQLRIKVTADPNVEALQRQIIKNNEMLKNLCDHLGLNITK